jgi:hypothetical protein
MTHWQKVFTQLKIFTIINLLMKEIYCAVDVLSMDSTGLDNSMLNIFIKCD